MTIMTTGIGGVVRLVAHPTPFSNRFYSPTKAGFGWRMDSHPRQNVCQVVSPSASIWIRARWSQQRWPRPGRAACSLEGAQGRG
jgi:hypothetical protein